MDILNNSKIVAGVAMLLLNLGAKYVHADLGKVHEMLLSNEYIKKIIVFCMFFVATRDISIAFLLTIFYIIVVDGILYEKGKFCLVPKTYYNNKPDIPESVYKKSKEIVTLYESDPKKDLEDTNIKSNYTNYISNISTLYSK
jgi:hypothetical protein